MNNPEEDTEWNDILRAHGILPPKVEEKEASDEEPESIDERRTRQLDEVPLDELDTLDDESFADDHFLEAYRRQRMAEIKARAEQERYGTLQQISEPDFIREVTEASKETWVVVHLFQPSLPLCRLLNERLGVLAAKYPATKFVKIIATDCIRNYPDRNLPTLLIYGRGDMQRQCVGTAQLGGPQLPLNKLERILEQVGALTITADKQDHHDDDDGDDGDEDDDDFD
ncbi:putative viral IAP-associated factor [Syncephalis pseudoplumigaleata]|uniref:Putative viral IAP-associated factor n=1 Tax=Syncephalis pseudoplumigaleata TaxID=1712513 RepID=A0A4P9Z4I9_9FUNG|nr:putative viral IAP-associated factor [Syncephalis pseudoplumigaleata]|eukprot:RKP27494.1 putative viral IAP-associated factor [Syncephalis pseudoplumigaleata]